MRRNEATPPGETAAPRDPTCQCEHGQHRHPDVKNCTSCLVPTCRCQAFTPAFSGAASQERTTAFEAYEEPGPTLTALVKRMRLVAEDFGPDAEPHILQWAGELEAAITDPDTGEASPAVRPQQPTAQEVTASEALAWQEIATRLDDAHAYCHTYNLRVGQNIWHAILDDAIRLREDEAMRGSRS